MEPPRFSNLAPCPKQIELITAPNGGHVFERVGAAHKNYDGFYILWQCSLCRRCVQERVEATGVIKKEVSL